jgi:hypothetical protein
MLSGFDRPKNTAGFVHFVRHIAALMVDHGMRGNALKLTKSQQGILPLVSITKSN